SFIQPAWRLHLYREDGRPDRRVWEIGLSLAIRDALRSGDLYLAESRRHVSFWNLVYDERQWADERNASYVQLNLPNEADRVLNQLCREYAEVVERAERAIGGGLIHLSCSFGQLRPDEQSTHKHKANADDDSAH